MLAIQRQPGANTVGVVDAVKARLPDLEASLPHDVSIDVTNDSSTAISDAVHDVEGTLIIVVGLVILVIYLFLGRLLATTIPGIAVPLSLIAACGGMYFFGLSIDNMSLLALTLAVGLVVDDAIVVFENIVRHVEEGMKPLDAAILGSREVTSTVISMSLSLVAIFIPILLMGGVVGRLVQEFGMVVVLAIAASAIVSLTITPMFAARLPAPKPHDPRARGPSTWFNRGFTRLTGWYDTSVGWCLDHRPIVLLVFLASIAGSYFLYTTLNTTFFPAEDLGQLSVSTQARPDISYPDMVALQQQAAAIVQASPSVAHVDSSVGGGFGGGSSSGNMFVQLKPKGERPPMDQVLNQLRNSLRPACQASRSFLVLPPRASASAAAPPAPPISWSCNLSTSQSMVARVGRASWPTAMTASIRRSSPTLTPTPTIPRSPAGINVDHDRASALGITDQALRATLAAGFGGNSVASIQSGAGSYDVILEYDSSLPWSDALLQSLRVRSASGTLVPLSSFTTLTRAPSPVTINQTGQLISITVSFNLPAGVARGAATNEIDAIKQQRRVPPHGITTYGGTAGVFQQSTSDEWVLVLAAVVTIYVILGALYESFVHPLTILSGLPAATFGALLALKVFGFDLSVIAVIGILMLIGIVKKNAIMMIDVALVMQREEHLSAPVAIRKAAERRFRPILMTTFCALLGTLPIALGTGASAELRQPLGVAVVGGLVTSQLLTLFITPVIFVEIERMRQWVHRVLASRLRFGRRLSEQPAPAE